MRRLKKLLGINGDKERPPEITDTTITQTEDVELVTIEIEYQNGDTETIEAHHVLPSDNHVIALATEPVTLDTYKQALRHKVEQSNDVTALELDWDDRTLSLHLLAREPITIDTRAVTYEVSYDLSWSYEYSSMPVVSKDGDIYEQQTAHDPRKRWCPVIKNVTVSEV